MQLKKDCPAWQLTFDFNDDEQRLSFSYYLDHRDFHPLTEQSEEILTKIFKGSIDGEKGITLTYGEGYKDNVVQMDVKTSTDFEDENVGYRMGGFLLKGSERLIIKNINQLVSENLLVVNEMMGDLRNAEYADTMVEVTLVFGWYHRTLF